jgi:formate-dependent nitrite reductase membrane component NrfD
VTDVERVIDETKGYYGMPVVKPPVWTWEVPAYFFVGGIAGMSAVIAFAVLITGASYFLARAALWIATVAALVSAGLLVSDLGRPARFLSMLRVFKYRSPMSVGAWVLAAFGAVVALTAVLVQLVPSLRDAGWSMTVLRIVILPLSGVAACLGAVLATYTGVLIGATAVPAWAKHNQALPAHFGVAALGSAAALLELLGYASPPLWALGAGTAAFETAIGFWVERHRHGAADRALRTGRAGTWLRTAVVLSGPVSLLLRLSGSVSLAAASFLAGVFLSRYGWMEAGRASAEDPEAVFATQRIG